VYQFAEVHHMKIKRLLAAGFVAASLALGLGATQVPALAGGGCHNSTFVDAAAAHVDLKEACFYPMVTRVAAGRSVTWTNQEGMDHTVTGVSESFGTYDPLAPSKSVTYRFDTDGVYPYFCLLHPGMVGAVVVGTGNRNAAGRPGTGIVRVTPAGAHLAAPRAAGAAGGWLPLLGLGGLGVLLLVATLLGRRRRGRS
jgi:plastocyanin